MTHKDYSASLQTQSLSLSNIHTVSARRQDALGKQQWWEKEFPWAIAER
jgi:hypothetical protein